jgi:hypothetical protein
LDRPHDTNGAAEGDKEGVEVDVFEGEEGAGAEGVAAGFGVSSGVGMREGDETSNCFLILGTGSSKLPSLGGCSASASCSAGGPNLAPPPVATAA